MHWKKLLLFILLTAGGCFAVFCVWYATAPGTGISPDSTAYIGAARSLLAGRGLTVGGIPLTHFPPLFPVLLALGGWCGPDPATVARWLNAVLLGANVFLAGYAIHRTTGAWWTALLGAVLVTMATDILEPHTWAWSEPLMLFFGLSGFLLLCNYFEEQRVWRLVLAAVCLALALSARYAAIPMIGTAILGILLFLPARLERRWRDAFLFALISCGLPGLWMLRNWLAAGTPTGRRFYTHWIMARYFNSARATMAGWFHFGAGKLTVERQTTILWVGLGVLLVLIAVLIWKTARPNRNSAGQPLVPRLPWLLLIYGLGYFGFLVVSISFFDFNTPLDYRILCPLHFALIPFTLGVLQAGCSSYRWLRWVGVGLLIAAGWSVWPQSQKLQRALVRDHAHGRGYASDQWRNCRFLERIRTMPDVPIYVNEVPGPAYYTGRFLKSVPLLKDYVTNQANENLEDQLRQMKADLTQRHGVLIYLRFVGWHGNFPRRDELLKTMNLTSVEKTAEAEVFAVSP